MFIKMKESKGFTLVELMIVVAIIGILAAVAVPYYQKYIQKSRLVSLVFPGVHAIETNIGSYYSLNNVFPAGGTFTTLTQDADTTHFTPALCTGTNNCINFTIKDTGATAPLYQLSGQVLQVTASTKNNMIGYWTVSGTLATQLGLAGVQ